MSRSIRTITTLAILIGPGIFSSVFAQPYSVEIDAKLSNTTTGELFVTGNDAPETESEIKQLQLTYYLQPVAASKGPLSERAFLSKSAFISASLSETEIDPINFSADGQSFSVRLVTQSDLILEYGYEKTEAEFDKPKRTTIGIGKYLGVDRLAIVSLETYKTFGETKTLNVHYRRLVESAAPNRYLAYGFDFEFLESSNFFGSESANDYQSYSGYQLGLNAKYYFSNYTSLGAVLTYRGVGTVNESGVLLNGEYFFTESLSGSVAVSRSKVSNLSDDSENESYVFGLSMRF